MFFTASKKSGQISKINCTCGKLLSEGTQRTGCGSENQLQSGAQIYVEIYFKAQSIFNKGKKFTCYKEVVFLVGTLFMDSQQFIMPYTSD